MRMLKIGRLLDKPSAIIFDLDDTILTGTENAWKESADLVFGPEFMKLFFVEVKKRQAAGGISFINYINLIAADNLTFKIELTEKYAQFQNLFTLKRNEYLQLSKGFIAFVEQLKKDRVKIILHSARSRETVIPDLKRFNIENYFASIYCKEDTVIDGKQIYKNNPQCLNLILTQENINRIKTWFVGDDLENDIHPAAVNSCIPILYGEKNKSLFTQIDNQGMQAFYAENFSKLATLYNSAKTPLPSSKKPILSKQQLNMIEKALMDGKKIALSVGVFDLFHLGHATLLAQIRCKAAEKLAVDYNDIYLIIGVQDQGRAVNDKATIFESEQTRINNVQNSGFCDIAISRCGYSTDNFVDLLNREINTVSKQSHPKSIDIWFTGADQSADSIIRAGKIVDSINSIAAPNHYASNMPFYSKMDTRSTHNLSSTRLRELVKKSNSEQTLDEKIQHARKQVENVNTLTQDAITSLLKLYQSEVIDDKCLERFNLTISDLTPTSQRAKL